MLVSAAQQCESGSLTRHSSPLPSRAPQSTGLSFVRFCGRFPLAIYCTQRGIYVSTTLSVHATLSYPLCVYNLFSSSVFLFLPCKEVHQYHFSRFHIYALIYCTYFSLSYLLHCQTCSVIQFSSVQLLSHV